MTRYHLLALRPRRAPRLRAIGLVLAAALSVACSSSTTPPEDPSSEAVFGANDLPPGTRVQVNRGGQWLPGAIVQPLGSDRFVVSYDGAGPAWNEAVGRDRVRPQSAALGPALARDYRAGEKVLVTSQNRLLLADVVQQVAAEAWRVHYDGYGPEAAENVGPERLRRPYQGISAHAVGEAIAVDVNGQTLPARVLALTGPNRWLVRYDGYGPAYDQEIGADRLRAPALPPPPPIASAPPPAPEPAPAPAPAPAKGVNKKGGKAEPAPPPPPPVNAPLQIGDAVAVSQHGVLFPATITAPGTTAGAWRVRFEGSAAAGPSIDEEEVAADRVQRLNTPAKGTSFPPNQTVLVEWHGLFVPARVLKEQDKGFFKVRYDGLGPDSDEIIPQKRLRIR